MTDTADSPTAPVKEGAERAWKYTRDGKFVTYALDLGECPNDTDWDQWLGKLGWEYRGHIPDHQQREFSQIEATIYRHSENNFWMLDVWFGQMGGDCYLLAENTLDFLLLLRDVIYPVTAGADRSIATDFAIDAQKYLFDPEHGLESAQRVIQRERREERKRLDERKKQAG